MRLTDETLHKLPGVEIPGYDRSEVTPGIVHFGVGGFHRAHQAMFVDRALRAGARDWGIIGVGVLPGDRDMRDALAAQDNLYTLATAAPDGSEDASVIGSIVDYLYAPDDRSAVVDALADPRVRIVSLTITEGGYEVDDVTGEFRPTGVLTLADLEGFSEPRSVLGLILSGLRRRRSNGSEPFVIMSCDNLPENGRVARTALLGFAERLDPELAGWIAEHVAFPNSMVDRITPATTDETRSHIAERFGIEDAWPVRSESFVQWVLEDRFPTGRPAFEEVGVQIVDDVEPYELMKLRLLNGSHQAMGYLGLLADLTTVQQACAEPLFVEFLLSYMHNEAIPTLHPHEGIDLIAYTHELIARFGNDSIGDTLARLVVDGADRLTKFVLPVTRDRLARGESIRHTALAIAAWSALHDDVTESGASIMMVDRRAAEVRAAVAADQKSPGAVLELAFVFGDLAQDLQFREAYVTARESLRRDGVRASMAAVISQELAAAEGAS